jgi:hypothetical protein
MYPSGHCPRITHLEEKAAPPFGLTVLSCCQGCPRDLRPSSGLLKPVSQGRPFRASERSQFNCRGMGVTLPARCASWAEV